jgi:hypothetical protein
MKRKTKKNKPRIPLEGVMRIRGGGVHSSKQGKKGYNRKKEKYNECKHAS